MIEFALGGEFNPGISPQAQTNPKTKNATVTMPAAQRTRLTLRNGSFVIFLNGSVIKHQV